jgi:hypothetical protein
MTEGCPLAAFEHMAPQERYAQYSQLFSSNLTSPNWAENEIGCTCVCQPLENITKTTS